MDIPYNVETIEKAAFAGCNDLATLTIGEWVLEIGESAFEGCTGLGSVVIPNRVELIAYRAFYGCTSLKTVMIGANVLHIGGTSDYNGETFGNCTSLKEFEVASGSQLFSAMDGVLFAYDNLVCYPAGKTDTSYTVPDGTTCICYGAFLNNVYLRKVAISEGVTTLQGYAFHGCENLTSVTIPDSVKYIGGSAFMYCGNLTDVYYCGSEDDWNAVKIFGSNNSYLTSATIHYNSTGPEDTGDTDTGGGGDSSGGTDAATPGDLNGDGEVNASDLTILARHVGKVETMEDETYLANADVTGDGHVDASDLTKLAQYVGKIISSLD